MLLSDSEDLQDSWLGQGVIDLGKILFYQNGSKNVVPHLYLGDFGIGGYALIPMKSKYYAVARTNIQNQGWKEGETFGVINKRQTFFKSWSIQRWNSVCLTLTSGALNVFMNGEIQRLSSPLSDIKISRDNIKIFGFNLIRGKEEDDWKSFQGSLTDLHLWSRSLASWEIVDWAGCSQEKSRGDVLDWADVAWTGTDIVEEEGDTETLCEGRVLTLVFNGIGAELEMECRL